MTKVFYPEATVSLAAGASAAELPIPPFKALYSTALRIAVIGVGDVTVAFSNAPGSLVASATGSMPVVSERPEIFEVPSNTRAVSILALSGTPTVFVTTGRYV